MPVAGVLLSRGNHRNPGERSHRFSKHDLSPLSTRRHKFFFKIAAYESYIASPILIEEKCDWNAHPIFGIDLKIYH